MLKKLFLLLVLVLACTSSAWADYAPGPEYYDLFEERFDNDFPPPGWRIEQTNPDITWHQDECPDAAHRCAVVFGSAVPSDERLITPTFQTPDCYAYYFDIEFGQQGESFGFSPKDPLSLQYSFDYGEAENPTWQNLAVSEYGTASLYTPYDKMVTLALRYTGTGGSGYQVKYFEVGCEYMYDGGYGDDDSYDDDDDDDNDSGGGGGSNNYADDDSSEAGDNDDEEKDDSTGGCHTSSHTSGVAMTAIMLSLGMLALLLSLRARPRD
ncbi:MAG: hypothetical protein P9L99_10185 [Candidatus Lernaella stagnicola]|nr:hypothetical protein [Candidatus Lernaella stagnicola]